MTTGGQGMPTAAERADGSTPIRRAIAEVLQAAALHMIASPECARAVDRVVELHLAARRGEEAARAAWKRVAAAWMVQAYGRGYGVGSDLMRWADETLGEWPDEPSNMTRAALAATQEER